MHVPACTRYLLVGAPILVLHRYALTKKPQPPSQARMASSSEAAASRARLRALEAELGGVQQEITHIERSFPREMRAAARTRAREEAEDAQRPGTMSYGNPHANTSYRVLYFSLNAIFVPLVLTTPRTNLRYSNGELNAGNCAWFFAVLAASWISYLRVQGSQPGFIKDPEGLDPKLRIASIERAVKAAYSDADIEGGEGG